MSKSKSELSLKLDEIRSFLIRVGSLHLEDLVERLALKTRSGHGEVDEGDSTADVWRELDRRIPCREEHGEGGREVDVLGSESNKNSSSCPLDLLVQDGVEDGIEVFDVLDENRVSESKSTLEVLEERLVEETRDGDLPILVLVEQERCSLTGGIDDERVSVESLEHDGVLVRESVRRERLGLPSESILRRREVLWEREFGLELDSSLREVIGPFLPHRLSVLLVEESGVGEEGGGEEDVADDGAHLSLEGLASDLPTFLLRRETSEESHGPVDLGLDSFHLALDRLGFADEESVLVLVASDA